MLTKLGVGDEQCYYKNNCFHCAEYPHCQTRRRKDIEKTKCVDCKFFHECVTYNRWKYCGKGQYNCYDYNDCSKCEERESCGMRAAKKKMRRKNSQGVYIENLVQDFVELPLRLIGF